MRVLRTPLVGLFLLGLAVALAVLVLGQGGATPAAAQPLTPHYECYDIPGTAPSPTVLVDLQTQFGSAVNVPVGAATKLCLPAGKNSTVIPDVPHLECYSIQLPSPGGRFTVKTQFGDQGVVTLGEGKLLCVPVLKTVVDPPGPPPSGPLPTVPHYVCYEIATGKNDPSPVDLKTQFGTVSGVNAGLSQYLCVPAIKRIVPSGPPEGSMSAPHLECYPLTGQPPLIPPRAVSLLSQFGVEGSPSLPVGLATSLCTPATKGGVGGIAELPASAGASGEEAAAPVESSGWSAGAYAALAGGLAAAAIVIAAGGWYARRRFIKS